MTVRSAVLRSMLVVVASTFTVAAKVAEVGGTGTGDRGDREHTMTPPGPLGPRASAGRRAVMTGVGRSPGSSEERED